MIPIQRLEDLAEELVPEHFIINAPQFYELIKSFLRNVDSVQQSVNLKWLDTIDFERIKNPDYRKIYVESFLGMLNFEGVENYDNLGDVVKISKHLGELKGTSIIFSILLKLLVFIIPSIGEQYNALLQEYLNETDPIKKADLERQLYEQKLANLDGGAVMYSEFYDDNGDLIPFVYKIEADITRTAYEQYIRPFCHPAGWHDIFVPVWLAFFTEILDFYNSFTLFDMFIYPNIIADGSTTLGNEDLRYPNNFYHNAVLGVAGEYDYYYDKMIDTDNLVIDGTQLKYIWDNLNNPPTYSGMMNGKWNVRGMLETPTEVKMKLTAGLYSGDTTGIGTANGSLTGGTFHFGYRIQRDDNKDWVNEIPNNNGGDGCD